MRKARASALALGVALLALPHGGPASAATALGDGVTQEAIFNYPREKPSYYDYSIHDRIVAMVDATPAGAAVQHVAWNISYKPFADAIIRAHQRGVKVLIAANGANVGGEQFSRVRTALGTRFRVCSGPSEVSGQLTKGCVTTHPAGSMHAKFILFSQTGTKKNVVVVGTTNMTTHGNETNDMLITAGDAVMYQGYTTHFDNMFHQRRVRDYWSTPAGKFSSTASLTRSEFSPRRSSNGGTSMELSTDTAALALKPQTGGTGCSVKVMERYWADERMPFTDQLVRLKREGCDVRVVSDDMGGTTRSKLRAAGIPIKGTVRSTPTGGVTKMHQKGFILEGTYNGVPRRQAFTGSHNLTSTCLRASDETFVRMRHEPIVNAYEANFDYLWRTGYTV